MDSFKERSSNSMIGKKIHNLCKQLLPLNRSLTGKGNRQTLKILKGICGNLKIKEVPSGKKVFDWTIPDEWNANNAWIKCPDGKKIAIYKKNNLHLVSYSKKMNTKMSLNQLEKNLHYLKDQPNAIPYVTSYYNRNWGFCMTYNQRKKLIKGTYEVFIDSTFSKGSLTYGEILIPGIEKKEIFLSTYICHPSMANNELSGITVTIFLAKWLMEQKRRYSYRLIFIPETIGSINYLSTNIKILKKKVIAGFNITCVGDNRSYSYIPSRKGDTLADKIGLHVIKNIDKNFFRYTWLNRGGDERQYCSPGVDLPIASIIRTKYGSYKEYHTSLDDLKNVVTPEGLDGGYNLIKKALEALENNFYYKNTSLCEPQMSKRGMYPNIGKKDISKEIKNMMNTLSYCDGNNSLIDISEKLKLPFWKILPLIKILLKEKIIKKLR
mgnify:CR=1 FL=1